MDDVTETPPESSTGEAQPEKPEMRVPSHGHGQLQTGNPGNAGGGRPAGKSLKAFLAELRQEPDFHKALKKAAIDPTSKGFQHAVKLARDYDEERPAQRNELTGAEGAPLIPPNVVRIELVDSKSDGASG